MVRAIPSLLAILITACGGTRAARDAVERPAVAPVAVEADEVVDAPVEHAPSPTVLEIALPGDRQVVAHALGSCERCAGQDGDVIALLATDGTGVTRHAIDVDAGRATEVSSVTLDAYPEHAAYDPARDLFWWTTSGEQQRIPTRGERAPRERVLFRSQWVSTLAGLRAEIRVCPEPTPPPAEPRGRGRGRRGASTGRGLVDWIGAAVERPLCDHRITALLPVSSGLLIGGSIAVDSLASPQPWLGLVSPEGTLLGATTLDVPMREGWVDGLVATDAGVFVLVWSRSGSSARGQLVLLREGTLETLASVPLETMSSMSQPWSALAAAPDGGLWMVVPRFREQLVLVVVGRDGAIVREQTIPGVTLPVTSTQHLAVRAGAPWLAIAEPYAEPSSRLRLVRLDPVSGASLEHHEAALPARFYGERMLGTERGFVLAGRVDMARAAVVWVSPPAGALAPEGPHGSAPGARTEGPGVGEPIVDRR